MAALERDVALLLEHPPDQYKRQLRGRPSPRALFHSPDPLGVSSKHWRWFREIRLAARAAA